MNTIFLYLCVFIHSVSSWDCFNYALSYPDSSTTIHIEQREQYLTKLCDAIHTCHSNPQLISYDLYIKDVLRCYDLRVYNFDKNILDIHRPIISQYICSMRDKSLAEIHYDTLDLKVKDMMTSIINVIRIRDSYLREFQYPTMGAVIGDVLFLLKSTKQTFALSSSKQHMAIKSMCTTTRRQIESAHQLQQELYDVQQQIQNLTMAIFLQRTDFDDFVVTLQENVVASFLEIENDDGYLY